MASPSPNRQRQPLPSLLSDTYSMPGCSTCRGLKILCFENFSWLLYCTCRRSLCRQPMILSTYQVGIFMFGAAVMCILDPCSCRGLKNYFFAKILCNALPWITFIKYNGKLSNLKNNAVAILRNPLKASKISRDSPINYPPIISNVCLLPALIIRLLGRFHDIQQILNRKGTLAHFNIYLTNGFQLQ